MERNFEKTDENEQNEESEKQDEQKMKHDKKKNEIEELQEKLKQAEDEAYDWKNKYYMSLADIQNLRKSLEEDHRNALRYRSEGFLENLLPALDNFYIALAGTANTEEANNYKKGFSFVYNQIQNALESEGVTEIVPHVNDQFDFNTMNAIETEDGDETNDGKVAFVYSKGYKLHERLIRPANVKVYKKVNDAKEESDAIEEANKA